MMKISLELSNEHHVYIFMNLSFITLINIKIAYFHNVYNVVICNIKFCYV